MAVAGAQLDELDIITLFAARGADFERVCASADALRTAVNGDRVAYVVNRNINYTNVCYFRCQFCAFSKGKLSANLRGRPYDLALDEIQRRCVEAWERGATEVCLQGGIHPDYSRRDLPPRSAAPSRRLLRTFTSMRSPAARGHPGGADAGTVGGVHFSRS